MSEPATSATPRQRVVIVDDDPGILGTIERFVKALGHEAVAFADFDHARAFVAANEFDALIVDVRLGAYNGLQLVLLTRQTRPNARIVAISGYADAVLQGDAVLTGSAFLMKPVTLSDLQAALAL